MTHRQILAFFICTFDLVAGQPPIYKLKGLEVNMIPSISGHPDEILWKHNGNKVVDFNGREEQVFPPYENRVTLGWTSADLSITHLTYEDSGDYELETYTNNQLSRANYKLEVIDKVAKPTISCEMIDSSSSNKSGIQATLVCSAESSRPQSLMKFEWSWHGRMQPGPKLPISLGDELDDEVYSCDVSNPLSNDMATFSAKDCYPGKSPPVGLIVGIVIAIIAVLLLLLLILGCMFRRKLRKACCEKGERESDQRTTQGESQPFLDRAPTLPSNQRLCSLQSNVKPQDPELKDVKGEIEELRQKGLVRTNRAPFETNNGGQISPKKLPADTQTGSASPLSSPGSKPPSHPDLNVEPVQHASNNKGEDADAEKEVPPCDSSDSEEANEPDPAGVLDAVSEDMQSDVQSSTAPEQTESEKEEDEEEEAKSACASAITPPPPQLCSPSTQSSPHMAPGNITVKLKEDTTSDQVTGETTEKNHRESDSSDDSSEEKQSSTIPARKGSASPLSSPGSKPPSHPDLNVEPVQHASNNKGEDADAEKEVPPCDSSDSEEANEPDPAGVLDAVSEDMQSDVQSSTAPEQTESEQEEDEEEEAKSASASAVTPPPSQLRSASTQSSPHMAPEDITVKLKEDTSLHQVTSEKNHRESDSSADSSEEKQP